MWALDLYLYVTDLSATTVWFSFGTLLVVHPPRWHRTDNIRVEYCADGVFSWATDKIWVDNNVEA